MPARMSSVHRRSAANGPAQAASGTFERQQAALLKALLDAQGAVVSFAELQHTGVEFPASVVSELELVGVPIERSLLHANGDSVIGVQLDPSWRQGAEAPLQAREDRVGDEPGSRSPLTPVDPRPPGRGERTLRLVDARRALASSAVQLRERATSARRARERSNVRWLGPALLLAAVAAVAAVAALAVVELSGSGQGGPVASAGTRQASVTRSVAVRGRPPTRSTGRATDAAPAVPVSPQLAVQLEGRGHELLQTGQYTQATRLLTQAAAATGENLANCLQPVSESCLTYAYALYDLGQSLALGGRPAQAVPVLERRLQIDNQRPTVASALARARAEAG
jgi:hypothetical protein